MADNVVITFTITFLFSVFCHSNAYTLFSFSGFPYSVTENHLKLEGDASSDGRDLQLTSNQVSTSRASYAHQIPLWSSATKQLADFTTHFSFKIISTDEVNKTAGGDGLAFFLAPFNSTIPPLSGYGSLGLFSSEKALNKTLNEIVAVEFDTSYNIEYDPLGDHVGIDINSIQSIKYFRWGSTLTNGKTGNAWISYNSTTYNLSVFLTYDTNPLFDGVSSTVWCVVDLRTVLPQNVRIGFSATTGRIIELHTIYTWSFNSSLDISDPGASGPSPRVRNKYATILPVGIVVSILLVVCGVIGLYLLFMRRKELSERHKHLAEEDLSLDDEFERGAGLQKFSFAELNRATNNFEERGKLGEGGFGGVYKGLLTVSRTEIAVKRISAGSNQGKKEYVSEVRTISRLRHRNLVQLIGCCHEKHELLLVYEYMPNGSLDSHLFGKKAPLTWELRYQAALGLASALLYLHEDNEHCVVHRDIKASNVMLDSEFNAKLGDFGLARFVDHKRASQTTVLAGTIGYLAPECVTTGKSSKETDVYSFGVVALEVACGRKAIETMEEEHKVVLVKWVWDLYKSGQLLDAGDVRLRMAFHEAQMECLMVAGLWCCHPDSTLRPSIRQVINILKFDVPLSTLPSKLLAPVYPVHSTDKDLYSFTSTTTSTTVSR